VRDTREGGRERGRGVKREKVGERTTQPTTGVGKKNQQWAVVSYCVHRK
jgi:hypothetical protein